jgi:hypothetical protein
MTERARRIGSRGWTLAATWCTRCWRGRRSGRSIRLRPRWRFSVQISGASRSMAGLPGAGHPPETDELTPGMTGMGQISADSRGVRQWRPGGSAGGSFLPDNSRSYKRSRHARKCCRALGLDQLDRELCSVVRWRLARGTAAAPRFVGPLAGVPQGTPAQCPGPTRDTPPNGTAVVAAALTRASHENSSLRFAQACSKR